jgi:hypothetical protein
MSGSALAACGNRGAGLARLLKSPCPLDRDQADIRQPVLRWAYRQAVAFYLPSEEANDA